MERHIDSESKANDSFKCGDVAYYKSSKCNVTILEVIGDKIKCAWFEGAKCFEKLLPQQELLKV